MIVYVDGKAVQPQQASMAACGVVCVAAPQEERQALELLGFEVTSVARGATRFESHMDHDFLMLNVPRLDDLLGEQYSLAAWFTAEKLVVVGNVPDAIAHMEETVKTWKNEPPAPEQAVYQLFSGLLTGDAAFLESLEEKISELDDGVMQKPPRDCTDEITLLRKQLLVLKRYYEALFDLLEDLEENQNGFFAKAQLRNFRLHTNRADRLAHSVVNLRDYLTQVREAYQNQLDISLNQTMKLFTVITAIFLPLTLIAGWFGMNLQMPEYSMPYAYPAVIGVSVLIVGGLVWYFKKNKWF